MGGAGPEDLHVAFFRNMNLGQARSKSPTSAALVAAFTAAGAADVRSFQTNGTVIFRACDPSAVVAAVSGSLRALTGYADAVVVREASWLVALAARLDPGLPAGEVALFDAPDLPAPDLPWRHPAVPALTVLALDDRHAVTSWADPARGSASNVLLARLTGVPVTCRGVGTMLRLAARLRG